MKDKIIGIPVTGMKSSSYDSLESTLTFDEPLLVGLGVPEDFHDPISRFKIVPSWYTLFERINQLNIAAIPLDNSELYAEQDAAKLIEERLKTREELEDTIRLKKIDAWGDQDRINYELKI